MTNEIGLMLLILAISVFLFIVDWLRVDVVAVLILLVLGGLTVAKLLAG